MRELVSMVGTNSKWIKKNLKVNLFCVKFNFQTLKFQKK